MLKTLSKVPVFLLVFTATFDLCWPSPVPQKPFLVVLDPGHGGEDLGAVRDSFYEKEIVLQIALQVQKILARQEPEILSQLTRTEDRSLSLQERVNYAKSLKADLLLSLHANSASSRLASGMEFYFSSPQKLLPLSQQPSSDQTQAPDSDKVLAKIKADFSHYMKTEKSLILSQLMQQNLAAVEKKSVIRRAPFYVIENTEMPSVLIELGFITNRREARLLTSPEHQMKIAELLTQTIIQYRDNLRKE